jgi:hypothetical protein
MARYARTAAGAKEAKTSPSRSKSRAAKPQLTKPKLGQGKRGLSESETVRQGLMKGMKEFPHWAKPVSKSRAAKGKANWLYLGEKQGNGQILQAYAGKKAGRGGRGLPESEQVRKNFSKTIDRLAGQKNKTRKSSRKIA